MECDDARQSLRKQEHSAALSEHIASCSLCAALHASAAPKPATPDWQTIAAGIAAEPSHALHAWSHRGVWIVAVLLSMTIVEAVAAGIPALDLARRSPLLLTIVLGTGTLLTGLGLIWHLRPLYRPALTPTYRHGFVAAVIALSVGTAFLPWPLTTSHIPDGSTVALAARCFAFGALLASPLLVWLTLAEPRTRPSVHTALLGLATAALVGVMGLELHCPVPGLAHRLLGHASLPIAVYALGIFAKYSRKT
jgi:hypothetical protein